MWKHHAFSVEPDALRFKDDRSARSRTGQYGLILLAATLTFGTAAWADDSAPIELPNMLVTPGGHGEVIRLLSLQIISEIGISVELPELRGRQLLSLAPLPRSALDVVQWPSPQPFDED